MITLVKSFSVEHDPMTLCWSLLRNAWHCE